MTNKAVQIAPKNPSDAVAMYDYLHPIFLMSRMVIDDRAIPIKFPDEIIELAVLLLSCGK